LGQLTLGAIDDEAALLELVIENLDGQAVGQAEGGDRERLAPRVRERLEAEVGEDAADAQVALAVEVAARTYAALLGQLVERRLEREERRHGGRERRL